MEKLPRLVFVVAPWRVGRRAATNTYVFLEADFYCVARHFVTAG